MKIRHNTLIIYSIFLFCNLIYYYVFSMYPRDINSNLPYIIDEYYGYFTHPVIGDHYKYLWFINPLEAGQSLGRLNNTTGVCYFYYFLRKLIPLDFIPLSFLVNNILFILSYIYFVKVLEKVGFSRRYSWIYFLNPQLIYFSHMINKEAFTLFTIFFITYLMLNRSRLALCIFLPLLMVIRMQHGIFALFFYLLYYRKSFKRGVCYVYLISALGAVMLATLSNGNTVKNANFSLMIFNLNREYYVGNLLFAPLKIVQNIYDMFLSFRFIRHDGLIDLYRVRDIFIACVLIAFSNRISRVFLNMGKYCQRGERVFISIVIAYFFTVIINPMTHSRYIMPIQIVLIALGMLQTKRKLSIKSRVEQT